LSYGRSFQEISKANKAADRVVGRAAPRGANKNGNQQIWLKEDGTITITDGFGASLVFNGKKKGITISDGNGATITLDGTGKITAKSTNNTIDIDANKTLTLDSDGGTTLNAPSINTLTNSGTSGPYNPGD
jgi:hypothetical protein